MICSTYYASAHECESPWLNTLLLAGILTTLLLIWCRMPPTRGEMLASKDKKAIFLRSPFVRADVTVGVAQPVQVVATKE